jgi:2-hydroxyacylsphingosine 1-beta-galactosyltransferase
MNCIKKNVLIDLLNYLDKEKIGVVLNLREEHMNDAEIKNKLPKNIFVVRWINQNDLLGDKRLNLFITHGGANSVYESVYHGKPMIVLGVGLDHFNTASIVKSYSMGEVFQSLNLITKDNLINAINKIRYNKTYEENTIKQGKVLKAMKNPREEFKFWLDFIFEVGYDSLFIKAYLKNFSWISVNGYDVAFVWIIICIILFYLFKFLVKKIYKCFCGTCEGKHKKKKKSD